MDLHLVPRLVRTLPDVEISDTGELIRRRARAWVWPALQMGIAAAVSWWAVNQVAGSAASYAPITAIAALGLGRERRLRRSVLLVSGLVLGMIAAEVATGVIGVGWWQIGVCMAVAAIVTGALVGRDLAVTYAAINAVVLLATPGSSGWLPNRLIAGLVGVGTALIVLLLVAPARPAHLVRHRLGRAADRAAAALEATAESLEHGLDVDRSGDERATLARARRLDDEIEQSHETVAQAVELVRWSPWRRSDAAEVERLRCVAQELRPAHRTVSTIARLTDRAGLLQISPPEPIRHGICHAGATMETLTRDLLDGSTPAGDDLESASDAVEQLMAAEVDHAILIALKEEVRGLLADLDGIVETVFDDPPATPAGLRADSVGDIVYGNHTRP